MHAVPPLSGELRSWRQARGSISWASLLLGNGASIAVWPRFEYSSLLARAPLRPHDRDLFDALETSNFESVLNALQVARLLCGQQGHETETSRRRYRSIRRALVAAIQDVHIRYRCLPVSALASLRDTYRTFDTVYTSNYDLLLYWAIMVDRGVGFRDFLWNIGSTFDITDTDVPADVTRIMYLHGALHLYTDSDGVAAKRTAGSRDFLRSIAASTATIPLFVSEGRSNRKLRAIRRSDYLSFVYKEFTSDVTPIVVFGHSLADQDAHLREGLNQRDRRVAISLMPDRPSRILGQKARLREFLPRARLRFFDATTHPLGDPGLRVSG